jgi:hypothetical protein
MPFAPVACTQLAPTPSEVPRCCQVGLTPCPLLCSADLLLRLDEEIPKKNILSVEAVETVLEAAQPGTDHECAICVCDLEEGEPATRLRCCGYVYHRCCIQQWLTMGKATCPMCSTQQCMTIAAP